MAAHMFLPQGKPALPNTGGTTSSLTRREGEVLKFIATGLTAKEIASRLDLSLSSVETYKTRASQKLGVKSRAEIVRYASAQGWLASV
jgi:DNA-binding NarL/FixJ family response regulator